MRQDEAYIEHLEVEAIQALAEKIYKNRPEKVQLPTDYPQTTPVSQPPTETLPQAVLTDETLNGIKDYMQQAHIQDFSAAVNQLIHKGLKYD